MNNWIDACRNDDVNKLTLSLRHHVHATLVYNRVSNACEMARGRVNSSADVSRVYLKAGAVRVIKGDEYKACESFGQLCAV